MSVHLENSCKHCGEGGNEPLTEHPLGSACPDCIEELEHVYDLNDIADRQYAWLQRVGWTKTNPLEDLALIASEVGEAVNECRGEKPTAEFGTELADIVLRVLGLARKNNIDIAAAIADKMELNESRCTRGRLK